MKIYITASIRKMSKDNPRWKFEPNVGEHYLTVPYNDKDMVKQLGAKWDPDKRMWYVPDNTYNFRIKFAKWLPPESQPYTPPSIIYLNVPFEEKDDAKVYGAKWDKSRKQWYVEKAKWNPGLSRWLKPGVCPDKPKN